MPKPISPVDLDFLVEDSGIPLVLVKPETVRLNQMEADVFAGFIESLVGFIQIPDDQHGRLFTHCNFSQIGFEAKDKKSYLPVFIFEKNEAFFDSEIYNDHAFATKPWVVLYHGRDNCSYGRRFKSKFEATRFSEKGFVNGFSNVAGKLEFYNS